MIGAGYWHTADPYEIIGFGAFIALCLVLNFILARRGDR